MGGKETWEHIAKRVSYEIMRPYNNKNLTEQVEFEIRQKKFIPAGRYLYSAGRPYSQVSNCFKGDTEIVTRYGTKTLKELAGQKAILMTSFGRWAESEVKHFGKQELLKVTLSRNNVEKILYATPNHSWRVRNSVGTPTSHVDTISLKQGDKLSAAFGYGISRTPISIDGIRHGIVFGVGTSRVRLCEEKNSDLSKYFRDYRTRPCGNDIEIFGLPRHYKNFPDLAYDRSYLLGWLAGYIATDGCVDEKGCVSLSSTNIDNLKFVKDVCYLLGIGATVIHSNEPSRLYSISLIRQHLTSDFFLRTKHRTRFESKKTDTREPAAWRVESVEKTGIIDDVYCAVVPKTHEFVLADNILTGNCLALRAEDSREGWSDLLWKSAMALQTGAGVGINYSRVRPAGVEIKKTGGLASGVMPLIHMVNEIGSGVRQGGNRRSAIAAILDIKHGDILDFVDAKKEDGKYSFTNFSVAIDPEKLDHTSSVWKKIIDNMYTNGEPAFMFLRDDEDLRNPCHELTAKEDSTLCSLGSINLGKMESLAEFEDTLYHAAAFLVAGTTYGDVPYDKCRTVQEKDRRIGIGLMGIAEFLAKRNIPFGYSEELEQYLKIYSEKSTLFANVHTKKLGISPVIKSRAVAPTGTISLVAQTTGGIEPVFCTEYIREYYNSHGELVAEHVIDPVAERIKEECGISYVQTAYDISIWNRLALQAQVQKHVDMAVSSTINFRKDRLTKSEMEEAILYYSTVLKGLTVYPLGSRENEPIKPIVDETSCKSGFCNS